MAAHATTWAKAQACSGAQRALPPPSGVDVWQEAASRLVRQGQPHDQPRDEGGQAQEVTARRPQSGVQSIATSRSIHPGRGQRRGGQEVLKVSKELREQEQGVHEAIRQQEQHSMQQEKRQQEMRARQQEIRRRQQELRQQEAVRKHQFESEQLCLYHQFESEQLLKAKPLRKWEAVRQEELAQQEALLEQQEALPFVRHPGVARSSHADIREGIRLARRATGMS